jgi:membrane-associated HD superfamily phosphohydrolase
MRKESRIRNKWKKMQSKKKMWILYSIIPTISPVIVTILIDLYYGYTLLQVYNRHILELVLVTYAILVGVISEILDLSNTTSRKIYAGKALFVGFLAVAAYCFFYSQHNQEEWKYILTTALFFALLAFFTIKIGMKLYQELPINNQNE